MCINYVLCCVPDSLGFHSTWKKVWSIFGAEHRLNIDLGILLSQRFDFVRFQHVPQFKSTLFFFIGILVLRNFFFRFFSFVEVGKFSFYALLQNVAEIE